MDVMRKAHAPDLFRFKREFRGLADIVHPNLVTLYELVADAGRYWFSMALVNTVAGAAYQMKEVRESLAVGEPNRAAHALLMMYIERKERFSAAHQLYNPNWTEEQNDAVFGKCANKNFHGHNFTLIVTVKGKINPDTGFVMNLVDLKKIIQKEVIEKVDHANLNHG